ncbi:MAG: peptidyl-prolyl cis-trans isomerase [Fusobacterium sp.]|nr:peptidyl-prolyl cis-trans isomerase [Fusobacterium sp.]
MDIKLIHSILLKKAKEASYKNIEIEEINHNYENILIEFFLRRETLRRLEKVEVKEEELKEIYELNKEKFLMEEKVKLDTIFLTDKGKAEKLLEEVNVKNFDEYKEKYDEKSSKEDTEDREALPLSRIQPAIVEIISKSKKGLQKKLAETEEGVHIVYLKEREEARTATYEESRDLVLQELNKIAYNNIYNQIINEYISEEAKISEINTDLNIEKNLVKKGGEE